MNHKVLALGLFALIGTGCTLPTEEQLVDQAVKKLNIDKGAVLVYTQVAMKQAAMASSAMTAEAPKADAAATAARFSPLHKGAYHRLSSHNAFRKSTVTADACVVYSDNLCNEDGTKCSYTEDYSACGADFKGKITRTFEGDFETYKVTVDFDQYAEKVSTDPAYYAFNGKTVMSGTIGISSASLSLHADGTSGSNIAGRIVSIKTSSDMTMVFLNNALTVNGTQAGTIVETGQAASMSVTELKYEDSCKEGPTGGTVKTTIDSKESVTVITSCGKGTITVDGEAEEVNADQIKSTFNPGTGINGESGFAGIIEGTDGGSLLSGDWMLQTATQFGYLSVYEVDGVTYVYYNINTDKNADGDFYGIGDEFVYGDGTLEVVDGKAQISWNNYGKGSNVASGNGPMPEYTEENHDSVNPLVKTYTFDLSGNGELVFDGFSFTKFDEYTQPAQVAEISNPLNGYWTYQTVDGGFNVTAQEVVQLYDDGYGYTFVVHGVETDTGANGIVMEDGDTYEEKSGTFTMSGSDLTPSWEQIWLLTHDSVNGDTWENTYDSNVSGLQVDSPTTLTLNDQADMDPTNDTLDIFGKTFIRQ